MNKLRKFLVVGVMVLSVIAMSGLVVAPASAAASAGDLIKMDGLSSVYYLGSDGKRYVFPNEATYMSWHADFSGVVTIPASELQSYPLGGNVTMRPGTKLVKITTDPSVYAVEPNGVLRKIQSEAQAAALYGTNWSKRVVDVADSFFTNYTIGAALADGAVPAGSLVKNASSAAVYYYDGTNYRSIASESALAANRFAMGNIITISNTITAGGSAITAAEAGLTNDAQGGSVGNVVVGSGVMVSLSSNTPASNDIPTGTSNPLLKFNVTAANDGDAIVSGVKLTAIGLGTPSQITAISVYKNNVKLNSTARNIDSNKEAQINFTNAVTIPAGTTATFEVRATVGDTGKHGLSIAKATDVMAGNTVSGSFPVAGNIFSGVTVTVGDLVFDKDGSALSEVKLGDKGATIAKFKLSNNANVENIVVKAVTLKKDSLSTASDSVVENLKLNFDGKEVAAAASISSRYVTFNLATPITINKNTANKRLTVTADVVDGAAKTIGLYLESASDITATGDYYGYQTTVSGTATGAALLATIKAGTISVEKVNAANDKLRVDVDNQEAGTFKVTVNSGKNAELSTLKLSITTTNDNQGTAAAFTKIENVEVYNKTNNTVYDLAYVSGTATKVYSNTSMGLMLTSGVTNELVVRFDTLTASADKDYTVKIADASTDLIIKETGNDTAITDITPNTVELKKVTIEGVGATFSLNALSSAFTAVIGTPDVEVLNFNVKAASNSNAYVRDLTVSKIAGNLGFSTQTISGLKLWKGTTLVKSMSSSQISGSDLTFTDLNEEIAANTTVTYKVTVSFVKNTDSSTKTLQMGINGATVEDVDGKDVSESGSVATSARTITLAGTGALYISMDTNDTAVSKDIYQVANTTTGSVAALKLRAENETVKVTKLHVIASENINGIVSELALYDGSTLVGSTNVIATDSTIDISGDKLVVPMSSKSYYLKATLSKIGKDATGALDKDITFTINGIEAQGFDSGDSLVASDADTNLESGELGYDNNNDGTITASGTVTGASKSLGILASRMSSVALVSSYSGNAVSTKIYSGQAANTAIIAVTADASSNTESNGDAVKTYINGFKVKVTGNASSTASTIERIGGTAGAKAGSAIADLQTTGVGYSSFTTGITGADFEVMPGTTAYFLVKVTPTFTVTDAGAVSINVSLDNMDSTVAVTGSPVANMANITWKDSSSATAKSPLRLGTTTLSGTTISN
ncbi:MAG: hypothetical protein HY931_01290 [Candidatus Falkowbacteria bacterium]|nr:MAG: hypothetical protein HY931_01290 [Candidatus Falkowbacteria bacterium]